MCLTGDSDGRLLPAMALSDMQKTQSHRKRWDLRFLQIAVNIAPVPCKYPVTYHWFSHYFQCFIISLQTHTDKFFFSFFFKKKVKKRTKLISVGL